MATHNQRKTDIHFMDPLCWLGNFLAIVPPHSLLDESHSKKIRVLYRWYTVLIFLLIIVGNGLAIMGRFIDAYSNYPSPTLMVTDMAVNISTTAANICAILAPSIWYFEDFKLFFQIFENTNSCLAKHESIKVKKCKAFYIELVLGHILLLIIFIYDAYVWTSGIGFAVFRHYIFRDFQNYHLYITVMTMYNFTVSIKYRFEVINNSLRRVVNFATSQSSKATDLQVKMNKHESHREVRHVSQVYERQIKQITLFNKIFGWQILFLTLSTMMGLLNSIDILTVYGFKGYSDQSGKNIKLGFHLIIVASIWAIWQLLLGSAIAVSCNKAETEAQQTADVCFNILLKLSYVPESVEEKALRDELILLSQLVIHRCPSFSAAGFFSIDYSLLLAIFGSITSYVIVLIQFQ